MRAIAIAFLCSGCATTGRGHLIDDGARAQVPAAGPEVQFTAPVPEVVETKNGLSVYVARTGELPLVHLSLVFAAGSGSDPVGAEGITALLGEVLKAGTETLSATALAERFALLGTELSVSVDEDSFELGCTVLEPHLDAAMALIADVVLHPAFAPEEFERVRRRQLLALKSEQDDPASLARRVFLHKVFGPHPYGHSELGNAGALERATVTELRAQRDRIFRSRAAALVLTGKITLERATRLAEALGPLTQSEQPSVVPSEAAPKSQRGTFLVDRPGAPQSQIRVGHLGLRRDHPDFYAVTICNAILGGMFTSRINMNLREAKGYTYGTYSRFDFLRGSGAFAVRGGIRTDVTKEALVEVFRELDTMRSKDVTLDELSAAKNRYSLSLPGSFQTAQAVAGMTANLFLYALPLTYYVDLPRLIQAVTVADVRRVALAHLKPSELTVVVVGDRSFVEAPLRALAADLTVVPQVF